MVKRRTIFLAPLAVAAAALPAVWVESASATGTGTGGLVHIYQVDNNEIGPPTTGTVVLTGAIGDFGDDQEGTGPGGINVLQLSQGDIGLDLSNFGRAHRPHTVNDSNCSYTSVVVGTVSIVPNPPSPAPPVDTGAYRNISGSFQVKATFAGVVSRNLDNSCNFNEVNSQSTQLDFAEGTGVLSGLPG
jgi:hypothetical protein